ncbi:MAG: hypothetical protein QM530_08590 [Phycisphaerales bacterium]|nr:hypothetical protein [Phycisphaerales bacterium]
MTDLPAKDTTYWTYGGVLRLVASKLFCTNGQQIAGGEDSIHLLSIAARATLVGSTYTSLSLQSACGVSYGKTSRFEFGGYFSARYFTDISKVVSFRTRLDLFCNYLAKDVKDAARNVVRKDNLGNITMHSDNLMTFKFNKHLNVSVGLVMVYRNAIPYSTT